MHSLILRSASEQHIPPKNIGNMGFLIRLEESPNGAAASKCTRPCPGLEVTKLLPFTMFLSQPRRFSPASKLPKCHDLSFIVFLPLPSWRPRNYQRGAICRVPALAQVGFPAIGVTKESLFIVFLPLPRWSSPPSNCLRSTPVNLPKQTFKNVYSKPLGNQKKHPKTTFCDIFGRQPHL